MDQKAFRNITSRILRHSGFTVKMNKENHEYELFYNSSPQPVLYCKPITLDGETPEAEIETYLCFRVLEALTDEQEKLYNRMIKRFTRLAPSINISFENETEPVFDEEQLEKLEQLFNEYEIEGGTVEE